MHNMVHIIKASWKSDQHCTLAGTLALDTLLSMDFLFFRLGVAEVGVLDGVYKVGVLSPPSSALPFLGGWYRGGRVVSSRNGESSFQQ